MKKLIFLNLLLILTLSTLLGCSGEAEIVAKPAIFTEPFLKLNTSAKGAHGGSTAKKALDNFINLPLITWNNFEYRQINVKPGWSGGGRENFCVVNETEGTPVSLGANIEFLEDATCFYTYYTSSDGVPHKYQIGLVKVRIPETGAEVWTWRTAVDIKE